MGEYYTDPADHIAKMDAIRQQQIDDFRKNTALQALQNTYGDQAADPDVWLKGSQASAAAQEAPLAGQTAQAKLQGEQLGNAKQDLENQNTQRDQRGRLVYGIAQMAKGQTGADGSMDPAAYDKIFGNPAVQNILGATPDQIAQYKPLLTAPGGASHLDSLSQAAIGPQPLTGAFSYGTDASGQSVAIGHDKLGRPIMQGLGSVTPTQVTQAQTGQERAAQGRTRLGIQQQNADTGTYRAGVTSNNSTYGAAEGTNLPQQGGGQQAPKGIRNNNPLNLQPKGQESSFSTPTGGMIAASNTLDHYDSQGIDTVTGVISKWAPPTDGNGKSINNTKAYIADVAKRLGVDPNAHLDLSDPETKGKLMEAMAQHENGQATPPVAAPKQGQQAQAAFFDRLPPKGRQIAIGQAQHLADQGTNLTNTNAILDQIDQQIKPYTAGGGVVISKLPGTVQNNLRANLETLSAQGLTSWINSLKNQQGQTGIGRVLQTEANAAMKIYGNMEQSQTSSQLAYHAKMFRTAVNKLYDHARAGFTTMYGKQPEDALGLPAYKPRGSAPAPGTPNSGWTIKVVK